MTSSKPRRRTRCTANTAACLGTGGGTTDRRLSAYLPLCRLWTLRTLVELGALEALRVGDQFTEPQLLRFADPIAAWLADEDHTYRVFDPERTPARLRHQLREAVASTAGAPARTALASNLRWLRSELGLDDLQAQVLLLCVLERRHVHLGAALAGLGDLSTLQLYAVVATLLGTTVEATAQALAFDGALWRSGLARVDENASFPFSHKIDLLHGVAERLPIAHTDRYSLFGDSFVTGATPQLQTAQFAHLQPQLDHLRAYLSQAIARRRPGVNVLIHGTPGTGKTELVRALAAELHAQLFEVSVAGVRGRPLRGVDRLTSFELSQQALARRANSLILFDEMEDIDAAAFEEGDGHAYSGRSSPSRLHAGRGRRGGKGWFNRMLETNPVPTVWVSNRIEHLDPAHLRRFDLHLRMDTPPAAMRARLLADQTRPLGTGEAWCRRMAAQAHLAPAVISRAARVTGHMRDAGVTTPAEALLEEVIGASLAAQRIARPDAVPASEPLRYLPEAVQASTDLQALVDGLRRHPKGRLCLYGPPGTGKSAFARHLASELGLHPMLERASDIVSPYVGQTEKHMAAMFRRAREASAVLILDEADSFLSDRQGARQRWEIRAINEMLTQMEAFDGLFVATTNLIDRLDEASLRRFDAKICFDFLHAAQVAALLRQACDGLQIDATGHEAAAAGLHKLTPGDFATVIRQARFDPPRDLSEICRRLAAEVAHKRGGGGGRPLGFRLAA
jgi:ATP-dependent 26S proteasome regulatory subunit